MEPYLDPLLKLLIKKTALDTNSFISEEADKALISLCTHCQDSKVLRAMLAATQNGNHKSNQVRQVVCKSLETLIKVLGNNLLFMKENDKVVSLLAQYLGDACPEVRANAKSGFAVMSMVIMGKNDMERLL